MAELANGPSTAAGDGSARPLLTTAGLALGPVVALGLARFAYSLLLPAMRTDLHWSYGQAGAMNSANALGYLLGAVGAGPLIARVGSRRPYLASLALTAIALLASAATANLVALLTLRLVAGVTGAVVFIAGAGLVAHLVADLPAGRSAALLGVYFAGGGLGVVISAGAIPPVVGLGAGGSWRWGWIVLGVISLLALAGTTPAVLRTPEPPAGTGQRVLGWPIRRLAPTLACYGLFGAGYIAYVTFIVAYLKGAGFGSAGVSVFWGVLGAAAVAAAFAWGPVLARLRAGRGPAAVLAVLTVGTLLPLLVGNVVGDFGSAVLFGGSFLAVVTAVTDVARRSVSPGQIAPAIAVLTVAFGVGQSLGPVLAGVLSSGPSGVRTGLYLSVGLLAAATLVALTQRPVFDSDRDAPEAPGLDRRGQTRLTGKDDVTGRDLDATLQE